MGLSINLCRRAMVERVTYRRSKSFNTKSNKIRVLRTPGGKLTPQYVAKKVRGSKCGDCGQTLQGIPQLKPKEKRQVARRVKTVSRPYGGSRCASCVRQRIVRAFLIEEQKIVKKVLKAQASK